MVRFTPATGTVADAQTVLGNLLGAIGAANFRQGWRPLRARASASGSNFSVPVALIAPLSSFVGTNGNAYSPRRETEEWTLQGRSTASGRRVDISLYGISTAFPDNFRLPVGGSSPAWVGSVVAFLNGPGAVSAPLAIDGTQAIWYSYINANQNSYWERQKRLA